MSIEILFQGKKAAVSDGIWTSEDPALEKMLTALCQARLMVEGHVPDIDLFCSKLAQEELRAKIAVKGQLPAEDYPPDAVF